MCISEFTGPLLNSLQPLSKGQLFSYLSGLSLEKNWEKWKHEQRVLFSTFVFKGGLVRERGCWFSILWDSNIPSLPEIVLVDFGIYLIRYQIFFLKIDQLRRPVYSLIHEHCYSREPPWIPVKFPYDSLSSS